MVTRRQHYVWQHYLRAWAPTGKLHCLRAQRVFAADTKNVALQKDFYRLEQLGPADLAFLKALAMKSPPDTHTLHEGWINGFNGIFAIQQLCESSGRSQPEVDDAIEEAIIELEEKLHGAIEAANQRHLDALRKEDLSVLSSADGFAQFSHFLSVQYMRTSCMHANCVRVLQEIPGLNAKSVWGVLRHIYATNVGRALYVQRGDLSFALLKAPPGQEFVTTDQPVINMDALGRASDEQSEKLILYYPLAPASALLIDAVDLGRGVRSEVLTVEQVQGYNRAMISLSHEQSFATNEALLRSLLAP
jgi:hypothetical protein